MEEVLKLVSGKVSGFLATVKEGKPKVRPFECQFEDKGSFYFCTSNKKEVFSQIRENPDIEFSCTSEEMVTLRISGKAVFCADREVKKRILDNNGLVNSIYKTPDNPAFETFYIEHGEAIVSDFTGKPARRYQF